MKISINILKTHNYFYTLFILFLFFISCTVSDNPSSQRAKAVLEDKGDIQIGIVVPAKLIEGYFEEGIELAVHEINSKGGLLGRKIKIVKQIDTPKDTGGFKTAENFTKNKKIIAVIGHYEYQSPIPASVIYQYNGILFLSTVSSNYALTHQGFSLIFRSVPEDASFAKEICRYCLLKEKSKRFIIINEKNDSSEQFANSFEIEGGRMGMDIAHRVEFNAITQVKALINRLKNEYFTTLIDGIFLAVRYDVEIELIKALRDAAFKGIIVTGINFDHLSAVKDLGKYANNIVCPTTFDPSEPATKIYQFINAFTRRYNKMPDLLAARAYNALNYIAFAIEKSKSTQPQVIANTLLNADNIPNIAGKTNFKANGNIKIDKKIIKKLVNGKPMYFKLTKEK